VVTKDLKTRHNLWAVQWLGKSTENSKIHWNLNCGAIITFPEGSTKVLYKIFLYSVIIHNNVAATKVTPTFFNYPTDTVPDVETGHCLGV
jgi:hypothetical protein